jgi:hypothetical protein
MGEKTLSRRENGGSRITFAKKRTMRGLARRDRGKVVHEGNPERAGTGELVGALSSDRTGSNPFRPSFRSPGSPHASDEPRRRFGSGSRRFIYD